VLESILDTLVLLLFNSLPVNCCQVQLHQFGIDVVGHRWLMSSAWTFWVHCLCPGHQLQTDVNVSCVAFFHISSWNLSAFEEMLYSV